MHEIRINLQSVKQFSQCVQYIENNKSQKGRAIYVDIKRSDVHQC